MKFPKIKLRATTLLFFARMLFAKQVIEVIRYVASSIFFRPAFYSGDRDNKPILYVYGFSNWKLVWLQEYFGTKYELFHCRYGFFQTLWFCVIKKRRDRSLLVWGDRIPLSARFLSSFFVDVFCLEDGFIRSFSVGAFSPPLSLTIGKSFLHSNSRALINHQSLPKPSMVIERPASFDGGKMTYEFWLSSSVSKYNINANNARTGDGLLFGGEKKTIAIIGQIDGDQSLKNMPRELKTNKRFWNTAIKIFGHDFDLVFCPHPKSEQEQVFVYSDNEERIVNPESVSLGTGNIVSACDYIFVRSSLFGLEAVLAGRRVITVNNCWWTTIAREHGSIGEYSVGDTCLRKAQKATGLSITLFHLDSIQRFELFETLYVNYPLYFHPVSGQPIHLQEYLIVFETLRACSHKNLLQRQKRLRSLCRRLKIISKVSPLASSINALNRGKIHKSFSTLHLRNRLLLCKVAALTGAADLSKSIVPKLVDDVVDALNQPNGGKYLECISELVSSIYGIERPCSLDVPGNFDKLQNLQPPYEEIREEHFKMQMRLLFKLGDFRSLFHLAENHVEFRLKNNGLLELMGFARDLKLHPNSTIFMTFIFVCRLLRSKTAVADVYLFSEERKEFLQKFELLFDKVSSRLMCHGSNTNKETDAFALNQLKTCIFGGAEFVVNGTPVINLEKCVPHSKSLISSFILSTLLLSLRSNGMLSISEKQLDHFKPFIPKDLRDFIDRAFVARLSNSLWFMDVSLRNDIASRIDGVALPRKSLLKKNKGGEQNITLMLFGGCNSTRVKALPGIIANYAAGSFLVDAFSWCFVRELGQQVSEIQADSEMSGSVLKDDSTNWLYSMDVKTSDVSVEFGNKIWKISDLQQLEPSQMIELTSGLSAIEACKAFHSWANGYCRVGRQGLQNTWHIDPENREIEASGVNFFSGFYERLATYFRRAKIDFTAKEVRHHLYSRLLMADKVLSVLRVAEHICLIHNKINIDVVYGNGHVAPYSVVRDFIRKTAADRMNPIRFGSAYSRYFERHTSLYTDKCAISSNRREGNVRAPFLLSQLEFIESNENRLNGNFDDNGFIGNFFTERYFQDADGPFCSLIDDSTQQVIAQKRAGKTIIAVMGKLAVDYNTAILGGPFGQDLIDWAANINSIISRCPDNLFFVIRPHPNETNPKISIGLVDSFCELFDLDCKNILIETSTRMPMGQLLALADGALIYSGSACFEFNAVGVPVIIGSYAAEQDLVYGNNFPKNEAELLNHLVNVKTLPSFKNNAAKFLEALCQRLSTETLPYTQLADVNVPIGPPEVDIDRLFDYLASERSNRYLSNFNLKR